VKALRSSYSLVTQALAKLIHVIQQEQLRLAQPTLRLPRLALRRFTVLVQDLALQIPRLVFQIPQLLQRNMAMMGLLDNLQSMLKVS
jgi:hypothetical protein